MVKGVNYIPMAQFALLEKLVGSILIVETRAIFDSQLGL